MTLFPHFLVFPPPSFSQRYRQPPGKSIGSTRSRREVSNPFLPLPSPAHQANTFAFTSCLVTLSLLSHPWPPRPELTFCMSLDLTLLLGPGPPHPPPCYLQSVVHGLPVRDQLIESRQVKVLAKQPQGHQLISRDLREKTTISIHRGCRVLLTGLFLGIKVHRCKRQKEKGENRNRTSTQTTDVPYGRKHGG